MEQREKSGASFNRGNSEQTVETPADLIQIVERKFGPIEFDLAANAENCKGPPGAFFSKEDNSLVQGWPLDKLCWLNPPFDMANKFTTKCATEATRGVRILALLPASVGANWFAQNIHKKALVLVLNGRVKFVGHTQMYPKDLMICAYGWDVGFDVWRWQPKKDRVRRGTIVSNAATSKRIAEVGGERVG